MILVKDRKILLERVIVATGIDLAVGERDWVSMDR
jgi:hypothetical protein